MSDVEQSRVVSDVEQSLQSLIQKRTMQSLMQNSPKLKWEITNTESGKNIRVFNKKESYLQNDLARRHGAACTARPKTKTKSKRCNSTPLRRPDNAHEGLVRHTCSQPLSRRGYRFPYTKQSVVKKTCLQSLMQNIPMQSLMQNSPMQSFIKNSHL